MTEKIRIAVIDDDIPSVQLLTEALAMHPDTEVVAVAHDLESGTDLVLDSDPDILFLDMAFPGANGLEWLESTYLPRHIKVVFYTCYQRYIHDALSQHVFDFLLKPFDPGELEIILARYREEGSPRGITMHPQPVVQSIPKALAVTTVTNSKMIIVPAEIVYFRYISERKLWECVLANMKRFLLKRQTTAEMIMSYGPDFVRTHKRFIVNVRYIGVLSGEDCLLLPPYDGITEIKISKNYRRELMDRFYDI